MRVFLLLLLLPLLYGCSENTAAPTAGTASASAAANGPAYVAGDQESPDITVTIRGAAPGNVILVGQYMDQQYQAMTATSDANGTVRFAQAEPLKPGFYFAYYDDGSAAQMLLDGDQTFTLTTAKEDVVGQMEVSGSEENAMMYEALRFEASLGPEVASVSSRLQGVQPGQPLYDQLVAERQAIMDRRSAYFDELFASHPDSYYTQYKRAGQNPDIRDIRDGAGRVNEEAQIAAYRYDFWNDVNFNDPRLLRTPVIANKLKRYITELTPQNADSIKAAADRLLGRVLGQPEYYKFFANYITLQYEPGKSTVMDADAVHVHLIQNYFTRERAVWSDSMEIYGLQQRADQMAHSLVGQQGPDITVPGIDGQPRRLYDEDADYLIVFMYNPDCEHCIEETPKLVSWHRQNKHRADVYAVALDTEADKWREFVRANGIQEWTNVFDPTNRSIFKTYYVDNTPELYLLDAERRIIGKNLKPEQLDEAIRIAETSK